MNYYKAAKATTIIMLVVLGAALLLVTITSSLTNNSATQSLPQPYTAIHQNGLVWTSITEDTEKLEFTSDTYQRIICVRSATILSCVKAS